MPAASLRRIGTTFLASGVVDQTMVGDSLHRLATHLAHAWAFWTVMLLAVTLMEQGHRNGQVIFSGYSCDCVDVLEVGLVGRLVDCCPSRFFTIDVGLGAFANTQEHNLNKREALGFCHFKSNFGIVNRITSETLPLSRAQSKDGITASVYLT